MRPFAYQSPASLEDALALLSAEPGTRPLAGGTDLVTLMKADLVAPARLIDVKRITGVPAGIAFAPRDAGTGEGDDNGGGLTLGALATLVDVETSPEVRSHYAALAEAAAVAATPQLRNMATLGGNLLQRPRCWYFRNPHIDCWLKGGDDCPAAEGENQLHAIFGASPCHAVHPSDPATALHAFGATVRLAGPDGERTVPIEDFLVPPTPERRTETIIRDDELLLDIRVPAPPAGTRSTYLKAMDRKVWAFALVGAAVVVRLEGRRVAQARITLGGVANVPWRAAAAERLIQDAEPDAALIERAADAALEGAVPLSQNGYKLALTRGLVRRALTTVLEA